jgi:peptide/nickel transport system substrate-binding protein
MPHLQYYSAQTGTTGVIRIRGDAKPFDDPRVRKAMRLAVDSEAVLKVALQGLGTVGGHHHVSAAQPDFGETPPMKRDVAAAKKLLADAGHPNGIKGEVVVPNDHQWFLPMAEVCQQQWKEAGIDIAIKPIPGAQYWDVWTKVPIGITIWFHRPLAVMVLGLAYRTGVPWNESGYSNKQLDELLVKAEGEIDVTKRKAIIKQIEVIMQEDGPLVQPVFRNVFTFMEKRVKGFAQHPTQYIFGHQIGMEA